MDTCASGGGLRGFSLLETLIALVLVGIAMTGLVVTFAGSGQLGVMGRRQATAMAIARSWASQLSHADRKMSTVCVHTRTLANDPCFLPRSFGAN